MDDVRKALDDGTSMQLETYYGIFESSLVTELGYQRRLKVINLLLYRDALANMSGYEILTLFSVAFAHARGQNYADRAAICEILRDYESILMKRAHLSVPHPLRYTLLYATKSKVPFRHCLIMERSGHSRQMEGKDAPGSRHRVVVMGLSQNSAVTRSGTTGPTHPR